MARLAMARPAARPDAQVAVVVAGLALAVGVSFGRLPVEMAAVASLVAGIVAVALLDTWFALVAVLAVRSSLDVFTSVPVVGDTNLAAVLGLLLIVVGAGHVLSRRMRVARLPLGVPFLVLIAVLGAGVVTAADRSNVLRDWLRSVSVGVLYLLAAEAGADARRRTVQLGAIVASAVVPVAVGLFQIVTGTGDPGTTGFNRIFGTFVHPSPYGFYLVTLAPLVWLVVERSRSPFVRLLAGLLLALMVVCILSTYTRAAWLGLIITALVLTAIRNPRLSVALILAVVAAWFLVPGIQERAGDQDTIQGKSGRFILWTEALSTLSPAQLPLGTGLGSAEAHLGNNVHNDYLRIWVEGGVLGTLALVVLYAAALRQAVAMRRRAATPLERQMATTLLAMMLARLAMFATDNILGNPVLEWYFWAIAGLAIGRAAPAALPAPAVEPTVGR